MNLGEVGSSYLESFNVNGSNMSGATVVPLPVGIERVQLDPFARVSHLVSRLSYLTLSRIPLAPDPVLSAVTTWKQHNHTLHRHAD